MDQEFQLELGGITLPLRSELGEMRALQKRIGGLLKVASSLMDMSITTGDLAAIVWHGVRGGGREALAAQGITSIEKVEDAIIEYGLLNVLKPCADFIKHVLNEGPKGKAQPPKATGETP